MRIASMMDVAIVGLVYTKFQTVGYHFVYFVCGLSMMHKSIMMII